MTTLDLPVRSDSQIVNSIPDRQSSSFFNDNINKETVNASEPSRIADHRIEHTTTPEAVDTNCDKDRSLAAISISMQGHIMEPAIKHNTGASMSTDQLDKSQPTDAQTVLLPTTKKNIHNRDVTQGRQDFEATASQQAFVTALSGSRYNTSAMMTLDENQELPSSLLSLNVPQLQFPTRTTQTMMGRRHSMDSNIGRSRAPTFVRTYREVKWKRVSKPFKSHQLPRTSSVENLAASAQADSGQTESREYITGTHIIRHRVPIFMTSADPPDPMGRRFSAGDLIPVTGSGKNWTPNGKCLVIRDMLPSKLSLNPNNDDSGSSSSSPASSSEDVGTSQSSDGSGPTTADYGDHYDFSLIDEDDEDEFSDGEEESTDDTDEKVMSYDLKVNDANPGAAGSSTSSSVPVLTDHLSAPIQTINASKPLDLRRLVLKNSLQQKSMSLPPANNSAMETVPQAATSQSPVPTTGQEVPISTVPKPSFMSTITHLSNILATRLNIISTAPPSSLAHNTTPNILVPNGQPVTVFTASTTALPTSSQTTVAYTIDQAVSHATRSALVSIIGHAASELQTEHSRVVLAENDVHADMHLVNNSSANDPTVSSCTNPSEMPWVMTSSKIIDANAKPTNPSEMPWVMTSSKITDANANPTNPSEMPWVMTSTKIADANVYVSSSHPLNSQMSVRSARWISPRNVDGTIPINVDDAKAIRVENVSVATADGHEPLQFQKVIYSSGFIISSAQWVAPTESTKGPQANEVRSLPSVEYDDRCSGVSQPASNDIEVMFRRPPGSAVVKSRKRYVKKSGVNDRSVLTASEKSSYSKSSVKKSKHKVVTVCDVSSSSQNPDTISPSLLDLHTREIQSRKFKRIFDVREGLHDPMMKISESELYSQHMLPSCPSTSKRRYIVLKESCDIFDNQLLSFDYPRRSSRNFVPLSNKCNSLTNESSVAYWKPILPLQCKIDWSNCDSVANVNVVPIDAQPIVAKISASSHTPHTAVVQIDNPQSSTFQDVTHSTAAQTDSDNPQCKTCPNLAQTSCSSSEDMVEPLSPISLSELATQLDESAANCDILAKRNCSDDHTKLRTDTEDDEKFAQENDALLQVILRSLSDNDDTITSTDATKGGGSTVAIDNKIEQAMDLVKRHLMYAVREEVEILKQQIGEMMERIGQLEYENTVLRSEAKPETLNKLLQPKLTQPQPTAASTTAPTSQQAITTQTQPSQQQQQQQQTTVSQVGQPPATT